MTFGAVGIHDDVADFTRSTTVALEQLAIEDQARPDAASDIDRDQV